MTFGNDWGFGADKETSRAILDRFFEAGGNFVDTAVNYTNGTSEAFLGEFLEGRRERTVVATKYTLSTSPGDPNACGNHRKNLVRSLEQSLKRLRTDYVDLLWVHAWDTMTPTEEVMRALDDVVRAGKVLYVGISDAPAWIVSQGNTLADLRGWSRFVALQVPYSLVERDVERELLPMAKAFDIAVTPWGALGGGVLSGKYRKDAPHPEGARLSAGDWGGLRSERNIEIASVAAEIARQLDTSTSRVALAWLLAQQERAQILPIVGARSVAHLEDNLGALSVKLPEEALAALEKASKIKLGFPHDFLVGTRSFVFGGTFDLVDNHRR
jgi:aryl-alcohol dehydrogenase-like predicted oxidoreductase